MSIKVITEKETQLIRMLAQCTEALKATTQERDAAQAEVIEQARLCGMGGEREAALLGKVAVLAQERDALRLIERGMELTINELESSRDTYQVAADELAAENKVLRDAWSAEPVAWMRPSEEGYDSAFRDHATVVACTGNPWTGWVPLYLRPTAPEQQEEPVAEIVIDENGYLTTRFVGSYSPNSGEKLYLHPPAAPEQPLTQEDIQVLIKQVDKEWHEDDNVPDEWAERFARAIEAHIKESSRNMLDGTDPTTAVPIADLARAIEQVEKAEPVAWCVSYDGKTPYSNLSDDIEYVQNACRVVGGTAIVMPLYAYPPTAPAQPLTCAWTRDDDESSTWASSCGELWSFIDGGPDENNVAYCHHCGGKVIKEASL